jgi:hypothetical protein
MIKRACLTFASLVVLHTVAEAAGPTPISGTFVKGPAVGGVDTFVAPNVLQVRDELGYGTLTGGVLTGSAVYTFNEQMVNFTDQTGTLRGDVVITTANGSTITLGLTGFFSGVTPTAQTITITGSWAVLAASGPDSGLHGEGQFAGVIVFQSGPQFGQTQGVLSGLIH